jgi:hypothetical protein
MSQMLAIEEACNCDISAGVDPGVSPERYIQAQLAPLAEKFNREKQVSSLEEVMEQVEPEERRNLMALSQAYLEWEQQTQQRGMEQGIQRAIASILSARFGSVDEELAGIMAALSELPIETATPILLQLTREELLHRFSPHPYEREDDNDL